MMDGYNNSWGIGDGYWFGWIIGIIILVIIIAMVVKISSKKNNLNRPVKRSPLDVIKDRYAKGEISKAEFEEKKRDVSS